MLRGVKASVVVIVIVNVVADGTEVTINLLSSKVALLNVGLEEKRLQEKIFNNPGCRKKYFNQYETDTAATSPGLSKKELEKKKDLGKKKSGDSGVEKQLKGLYNEFFNTLNTEA